MLWRHSSSTSSNPRHHRPPSPPAQAYDSSKFTPLVMEENSLVVTEDLQPSISSAHHHHRHSWGPAHDPHDHHYWHGRRSVKAELLACLQAAVAGFDKDNTATWTPAAEKVAACVAQFFDGCHDEPDLPADFTKSVPYNLFINGIEALATDVSADGLRVCLLLYVLHSGRCRNDLPCRHWRKRQHRGGRRTEIHTRR